ncbi:MAG: phage tail protein I [Anaerolineaceae bacterium]|nr:phage tail protein I [Anaerolineaceae bacterium]
MPSYQVAPYHARLECTATECSITDLGSLQGTMVNGVRLAADTPTALSTGDKIQIGPYILTIDAEGETPPVSPSSAQPSSEDEAPVETREPPKNGSNHHGGGGSVVLNGTGSGGVNGRSFSPSELYGWRLLSYLPELYHPPQIDKKQEIVFHPDNFLARFLGIFEAILTPIERNIDNFDLYLNPGTAPADFLPWLKNWFGIIFEPGWTDAQRRQFLRKASLLYARRGTRWTLSEVLKIFIGARPLIDDSENQPPHTFQVTIRLPAGKTVEQVDWRMVDRIIQDLKPAHTHCLLRRE